ncbi:MAG: hypothetical protein R2710_28890 [Acidimicrobiales bacterium]
MEGLDIGGVADLGQSAGDRGEVGHEEPGGEADERDRTQQGKAGGAAS